jgi:hypothetical protein
MSGGRWIVVAWLEGHGLSVRRFRSLSAARRLRNEVQAMGCGCCTAYVRRWSRDRPETRIMRWLP